MKQLNTRTHFIQPEFVKVTFIIISQLTQHNAFSYQVGRSIVTPAAFHLAAQLAVCHEKLLRIHTSFIQHMCLNEPSARC